MIFAKKIFFYLKHNIFVFLYVKNLVSVKIYCLKVTINITIFNFICSQFVANLQLLI